MTPTRLVVAAVAMALASACLAAEAEIALPDEQLTVPPTGPIFQLGRGIGNIIISPFEIPATMRRVAYERDPFFGLWAGGLEGVGNGLSRLSAGVIEVLTFPFPGKPYPLYTKKLGERATPPLGLPTGVTKP